MFGSTWSEHCKHKIFASKIHHVDKETGEDIPIEDLNLPLKAYNSLRRGGIKYISDIFKFDEDEIKQFKNFGPNSFIELENALKLLTIDINQTQHSFTHYYREFA